MLGTPGVITTVAVPVMLAVLSTKPVLSTTSATVEDCPEVSPVTVIVLVVGYMPPAEVTEPLDTLEI